jgi:hypothetical protein
MSAAIGDAPVVASSVVAGAVVAGAVMVAAPVVVAAPAAVAVAASAVVAGSVVVVGDSAVIGYSLARAGGGGLGATEQAKDRALWLFGRGFLAAVYESVLANLAEALLHEQLNQLGAVIDRHSSISFRGHSSRYFDHCQYRKESI